MRSMEEMQRDIDQFDFRLVHEKRVKKMDGGGLSVTHLPADSSRQYAEARRFVAFAERNWSVREIVLAASFHPAGTFRPHEDKDALTTRTRIEGTKDGCFVETREPTVVNYAGFGFATWEEAR